MYKKVIILLQFMLISARLFSGIGRGESKLVTLTSLPPEVPSLISPGNGASVRPDAIVCTWHPMVHVSRYHLLVSKQFYFSNPVINEMNIADTAFSIIALERNTDYYWCLRAVNSAGSSDWSQIRQFTTSMASLAAPLLDRPADGSVGMPATLELRWHAVPDATSYHAQVSETPDFGSLALDEENIITTRYTATLESGKTYHWRVAAANAEGEGPYSPPWAFGTSVTGVEGADQSIPVSFALRPVYPNPFNANVTIPYDVPETAPIELVLFNASGQAVKTLVTGVQPPGRHSIRWDGTDALGMHVPSGLYICRMKTENHMFIQKIMLLQ